jgi:hypothetical protein
VVVRAVKSPLEMPRPDLLGPAITDVYRSYIQYGIPRVDFAVTSKIFIAACLLSEMDFSTGVGA